MYKLVLFLFGSLFFLPQAFPQQQKSYFGGVHTPKGHLHMLIVFIRYEDKDLMKWDKNWPDTDQLPKMARGGPSNDLFHATPDQVVRGGKQNLSEFYYEMSGKKFIITADIFPQQVPVTYTRETARNFFARQGQLNKAAIQWITENHPNFDWSKYDKRKNNPNYQFDNQDSGPDDVVDYIVFMHRAPGGQTGMGASSSIDIPNSTYKIRNGHTGIKVYTEKKHNWEYFKHEFSHQLYHAPHYMGANHAAGNKYYVQKGWGLMSGLNPVFMTANAWERWWLGWFDPQSIYRPGAYQLKDFVTTGDAIRIQVPGTEDYLWIENHQKISHWDDKLFYNRPEEGHPVTAPGIFMYVVSSPGADQNKAQLRTFNPAYCNLMKLLNGQGYWDYERVNDTVDTGYFLTSSIKRAAPNPISGQNDLQEIRFDLNNDGKMAIAVNHGNNDVATTETNEMWVEKIGNKAEVTLNIMGDQEDAFQSGDEVSLSGILPVLNYPVYDPRAEKLEPFRLNGIRIRIGDKKADGSYTLNIDFNDYSIREDKRWCGDIILPSQSGTPYLTIEKGVTLDLDLSGTPNRSTTHPQTGTCANPTVLTVEANRGILMEANSTLRIRNFSQLNLTGNAQIVMEKGSTLEVENQGELILNNGTQIIVNRGAKVNVAASGVLRRMDGSNIVVKKGGKFDAKGKGRVDKGEDKGKDNGNRILKGNGIFE